VTRWSGDGMKVGGGRRWDNDEGAWWEETVASYKPHLINVLTLPSENENIAFHTFIMHSLNITRCIKLNDRQTCRWHNPPDWGLVSSVATCLALWSAIQQRVYETRVHDIDELRQRLLRMCGVALSSRWLMTQLTNGKRACVLLFVPVADILNILCDV